MSLSQGKYWIYMYMYYNVCSLCLLSIILRGLLCNIMDAALLKTVSNIIQLIFFQVREIFPSFTQYLRSTGQTPDGKPMDMPIHYHVEGEINAAYSEILFSKICGA